MEHTSPDLLRVLESAAQLQRLVPDAVLVGGTAAGYYGRHRLSTDHDHVLRDLADRFDAVLEAVESQDGWVTNRVTPGKIILGELGGIEAGVRQLIRRIPLEVSELTLPSGTRLTIPTFDETLRVKAFLIVKRNQTRDYLDVAALAKAGGVKHAATVLADIDRYYADQHGDGDGVAAQLVRQLGAPQPRDSSVTSELASYKGLAARWHDWASVRDVCQQVALAMATGPTEAPR